MRLLMNFCRPITGKLIRLKHLLLMRARRLAAAIEAMSRLRLRSVRGVEE